MSDSSDLAVAGGIGQGLMSFANSYAQAKQQKTQNALNQQQADRAEGDYQAGLLSQGMQQNADGTVGYTPQKQAQVDTANKLATQRQQEQSAMLDENSDESKATYQNIKARYDALPLGDSSTIPQGKSGQWYKDFYETPHLADAEKMNNAIQVANANAKGKLDVANVNAGSRFGAASNRNDATNAKQSNKAFTDMTNSVENFRGNKAVGNAADALRAVGNAQELIKEYPDLNQMPQAQVGQLGEELAKIAGGGSASEGGRKEVNTSTYASQFQNFMSKAGNQPTGAQLGDFIQNNSKYLDGLKQANQQIVNGYRKNKYLSYEDQLTDSQKQKFQTQMHPELFQDQNNQAPQQGQGLLGGSASSGQAHPQDIKAIAWAKANPKDPMSIQILKVNGIQ